MTLADHALVLLVTLPHLIFILAIMLWHSFNMGCGAGGYRHNQFGWDAGRGDFHLEPGALTDERPETSVNVVFVVPGKKPWHDTLA